jgi:hypothetical protein
MCAFSGQADEMPADGVKDESRVTKDLRFLRFVS